MFPAMDFIDQEQGFYNIYIYIYIVCTTGQLDFSEILWSSVKKDN